MKLLNQLGLKYLNITFCREIKKYHSNQDNKTLSLWPGSIDDEYFFYPLSI